MSNTTVPADSITDTSRGVYKVTGPCSMADPCLGDTCPEHGRRVIAIPKTVTAHADWTAEVSEPLNWYAGWDGKLFTPALVAWKRGYHAGEDWGIDVTLYDAPPITTSATFTPETAPAWVPRPPEGWDAGVAAVIASLVVGEVEHSDDRYHDGIGS